MNKACKTIFFNFIMLFAVNTFAQEKLKQKDIDTLYVKALQNRFDWLLSSGYKYVDIENQSDAPQKAFSNSIIKILPQTEIVKISRKENREFTVYTMDYRIISSDTVDVNFAQYYLKGLKKKGKNSPLAEISEIKCGYTKYEPDIRFVLVNNRWKMIKSKFIKD